MSLVEATHSHPPPGHVKAWRRVVCGTGGANRFCRLLLMRWRQDGDKEGWLSLSSRASLRTRVAEEAKPRMWSAGSLVGIGKRLKPKSENCFSLPRKCPSYLPCTLGLAHSPSTLPGPKRSRVGILALISRLLSLVCPAQQSCLSCAVKNHSVVSSVCGRKGSDVRPKNRKQLGWDGSGALIRGPESADRRMERQKDLPFP